MGSEGKMSEGQSGFGHRPVLEKEVRGFFDARPGGIYVDATVGLGGHAGAMLEGAGPEGKLICIDRDEEALSIASRRLPEGRCIFRKGRFSALGEIVRGAGYEDVDGVLFDFGVSMMQLRDGERGFSFTSDEPLDMRMDRSERLTASDIVNSYPEKKLEEILREFGEERKSRRIARAIVWRRAKARVRTCRELAEIVMSASGGRRGRIHPATRTFQGLRIAVNDEINEIRKGLDASEGLLKKGGRLLAISYHSLEDREVKRFMKEAQMKGRMKVLTKKPIVPKAEEIRENPSARSAKLRGAEKL